MTLSPSGASGPYTSRDIRNLYPSITDNHLRYLEKWGLVRIGAGAGERLFSFTDLLTVKHVAAELEAGTPLRVLLRTMLAERQGQLALDFQPGHAGADTPRAKVIALSPRKEKPAASTAGISPGATASCDASLQA